MIARPRTYGKYTGTSSKTSTTDTYPASREGFYRGRAILAHNIQGHPLVTQTVASSNKAPTETYSNSNQPSLGYTSKIPRTFPIFTTEELIIIGIAIIAVMTIIAVVLIHG